jgi:hypothetical protein
MHRIFYTASITEWKQFLLRITVKKNGEKERSSDSQIILKKKLKILTLSVQAKEHSSEHQLTRSSTRRTKEPSFFKAL